MRRSLGAAVPSNRTPEKPNEKMREATSQATILNLAKDMKIQNESEYQAFLKNVTFIRELKKGAFNSVTLYTDDRIRYAFRVNLKKGITNEELVLTQFCSNNDIGPHLYGIYETANQQILVSEAYDGDLEDFINNKHEDAAIGDVVRGAWNIITKACELGFFHGDIKCMNMLFRERDAKVVMTDFDPKYCMMFESEKNTDVLMLLMLLIEIACQYIGSKKDKIATAFHSKLSKLLQEVVKERQIEMSNFRMNEQLLKGVKENLSMYGVDKGCLPIDLGLVKKEKSVNLGAMYNYAINKTPPDVKPTERVTRRSEATKIPPVVKPTRRSRAQLVSSPYARTGSKIGGK